MSISVAPKTRVGKWSAGLTLLFLCLIAISVTLVEVFGLLSFDDHWWDVTVPVAFLIDMAAFVTGIYAVRKQNERSMAVFFSIFVGIAVILFVFLHSLFIND